VPVKVRKLVVPLPDMVGTFEVAPINMEHVDSFVLLTDHTPFQFSHNIQVWGSADDGATWVHLPDGYVFPSVDRTWEYHAPLPPLIKFDHRGNPPATGNFLVLNRRISKC
jgi:hypothetical protein